MKIFKRIVLLTLTLNIFSLHAKASYEPTRDVASESEQTPFNLKLYSNVGLNITRISGVEDVGFGVTAGIDGVWFFSRAVGLFVGADYSQLKGEENNETVSADYLDIPFGISFGDPSGSYHTRVINLGLYYGLPLSDLKVGSTKFDSESILGLNFESHHNFAISENFSLGFYIQIKYGFKDIVNDTANTFGTSSKPLTTSLGLSARF